MINIVNNHLEEIQALCKENEIAGLWLFGSAATGHYVDGRSDLDFLFDIGSYDTRPARRFMRLSVGLERLFGENIDLVSRNGIRSKSFQESVDRTAIQLYG